MFVYYLKDNVVYNVHDEILAEVDQDKCTHEYINLLSEYRSSCNKDECAYTIDVGPF